MGIARRRGRGDPQRVLATLAVVDIVESTQTLDRVGDVEWAERLFGVFDVLHDAVSAGGGVCLEHTGDGALVAFASATEAVSSVSELCRVAPDSIGVAIRAGVHTGEVIVDARRVVGMPVHVACRIQEWAAPGETLVSSAAAQFTTGDITYRSRGEVILRGVREPMELYTVEPGPVPLASERRSCREKGRRAPLGSV